MNINRFCLGCMRDKGDAEVCPYCGWNGAEVPETALFLPPGTILNGRYLIGRVLGHGGFGITYLAWDLNLQIKLAIKEYLPQSLATRPQGSSSISVYSGNARDHFAYGLEKFIDEARMLAKFNDHPCIVSVNEFFKENNTAYIVMSYIEGITFKDYLDQKGGKLSFQTAMEIMMPVMDALREVHSEGLLHRDISPDNIYITTKKQVKLLDFGAARYAVGEHSKSLSVILKPGYAPEEQYRSKGIQGPWTDVYTVAATIYRAITGIVPPEALDRLDEDTLQPPSKLGVSIAPEAEQVLLRALSVKAGGRIQTIKEFQDAIPTAIRQEKYPDAGVKIQTDGLSSSGTPQTLPSEGRRSTSSRPIYITVAAISGLALVALIAFISWIVVKPSLKTGLTSAKSSLKSPVQSSKPVATKPIPKTDKPVNPAPQKPSQPIKDVKPEKPKPVPASSSPEKNGDIIDIAGEYRGIMDITHGENPGEIPIKIKLQQNGRNISGKLISLNTQVSLPFQGSIQGNFVRFRCWISSQYYSDFQGYYDDGVLEGEFVANDDEEGTFDVEEVGSTALIHGK